MSCNYLIVCSQRLFTRSDTLHTYHGMDRVGAGGGRSARRGLHAEDEGLLTAAASAVRHLLYIALVSRQLEYSASSPSPPSCLLPTPQRVLLCWTRAFCSVRQRRRPGAPDIEALLGEPAAEDSLNRSISGVRPLGSATTLLL